MATLGSSKASVLAIMPEVTEGTPVAPGAATDFLALQPDATLTPSFDVLENEELRSKIIVMDSMVKKREATLKKAQQYIKQLELAILTCSQANEINLN